MNRQERRYLSKLRTKINFMIIICLLLSLWIKFLYSNIEDYRIEKEMKVSENLDKQKKIVNLTNQIDSIKKEFINFSNHKLEVAPPVVKKKMIIKKDTTMVLKVDTVPSDTTNIPY